MSGSSISEAAKAVVRRNTEEFCAVSGTSDLMTEITSS